MWRTILIVIAAATPMLAHGADVRVPAHRYVRAAAAQSAYPWTWRSRKIRLADHCWRGCEATAGRAFLTCLRSGDMSGCVQRNDAADRTCLSTCRLYGGPLVDWAE